MYKTAIAPIIAVIALALKEIFGIDLDKTIQAQIVDAIATMILVGVTVYGIIENHKKEPKKKDPQ